MNQPLNIATSEEIGALGVFHLKRLWSATIAWRNGAPIERRGEEHLDHLVLNALGIGLHQAIELLFLEAPTFVRFEEWIVATAGKPDRLQVDRLNADIAGEPRPELARRWFETIES